MLTEPLARINVQLVECAVLCFLGNTLKKNLLFFGVNFPGK